MWQSIHVWYRPHHGQCKDSSTATCTDGATPVCPDGKYDLHFLTNQINWEWPIKMYLLWRQLPNSKASVSKQHWCGASQSLEVINLINIEQIPRRWGQGTINCGASSQTDFILNYFLSNFLSKFLNFPKKFLEIPQIPSQIFFFLLAWPAG